MEAGHFNHLKRYKQSFALSLFVFFIGLGSLIIGVIGTAYLSAILGNLLVLLAPLICQHFYTRWVHIPRALERIKTFIQFTCCILIINALINVASIVLISIAYHYYNTSNDCYIDDDDYARCKEDDDDEYEKSDYTMAQMRYIIISLGLSLIATILMAFLMLRMFIDVKQIILASNHLMIMDQHQYMPQPVQTHIVEGVVIGQPLQQQSLQMQNQGPYIQQAQPQYFPQQSQYGIINPGEHAPSQSDQYRTSYLSPTEPLVYNTEPMQNYPNNNPGNQS